MGITERHTKYTGQFLAGSEQALNAAYTWDYEDKMATLTAPNLMMTFTTDGDGFRRSVSDGRNTKHFIYDHRSGVPV